MLRRQEKIPWCLGNPICIWRLNVLSTTVSNPGRADYRGQGEGPQTVSKNNSEHGKMSTLLLPVLLWSGRS